MAKVVRPKTYEGHTFRVVSTATMQQILDKRAELARRRADARAAISNEQKTRGRKPKPKVDAVEAQAEIPVEE